MWRIVRSVVGDKRVRLISTAAIYRGNNTAAVVAFVLWDYFATTVSLYHCIRVIIGMVIEIVMYAITISVGIPSKVDAVGIVYITAVAFKVAQVSALDRLVFFELLSGLV